MAKTKRSKIKREEDLRRISALYLQGKTQSEIADSLGLSQPQISYDLKAIRKRWREDTTIDLDEHKNRELERIDILERTYWQAWERSLEDKEKSRTKRTEVGTGSRKEASIEKEMRLGDPRYLSGIQWCITERCKLLGLYAAIKTQNEHTGRDGGPIQTEGTGKVKLAYYDMPVEEAVEVEKILAEARALGGAPNAGGADNATQG